MASNYTTDAVTVAGVQKLCQGGAPEFPVVEASIRSVHAAMLAGRLTCSQLVSAYVQVRSSLKSVAHLYCHLPDFSWLHRLPLHVHSMPAVLLCVQASACNQALGDGQNCQ